MISNEILEKIIKKSVFAPSGDNSQPWNFSIKKGQIKVFNYPDKDLPFYNYNQCGSHVAHGALIENIKIVASEFGLDCSMEFFPLGYENNLIAILSFLENPAVKVDELGVFIEKRTTNRKYYRKEKILEDIKINLVKEGTVADVGVVMIDDSEKISQISKLSVVNEITVLKTKQIHDFFFKHVVWNEKEEKEKRSGLYVKTLEMPKPQEVAFKLASFWPFMRFIDLLGVTRKIADDNARQFQASSLFIAFTSKGMGKLDFINIGRSMQRVWLKCTQYGISVQPITGVLFLNQIVKAKKAVGISDAQQEKILNANKEINNLCSSSDNNVLFLLRVGKSDPPSAISSKLDPVIIFE